MELICHRSIASKEEAIEVYKTNNPIEPAPVKKEVPKEPKPKKPKVKKPKQEPVVKKDLKPALPAYNDARTNGYIPSHRRAQPDERDLSILAQRVLLMLFNPHTRNPLQTKQRTRFSQRERDMLVFLKALCQFLYPINRLWISTPLLRDIMHEHVPVCCFTVHICQSSYFLSRNHARKWASHSWRPLRVK